MGNAWIPMGNLFLNWETYGWIAAMGIAVSVTCALLGCFLVLRKIALIGDAVSHAVLPGLALAFLFSHSRAALPMVVGAVVCGMMTTAMIDYIARKSPIKKDAAIGIVFTTLFAIGVILISVFADKVDLDQECVLYGEITFVPLAKHLLIGGLDLGPVPFSIMVGVGVGVLIVIVLFYKEFLITSFDMPLAVSLGINTVLVNTLLMGMVSASVVAAFESVGAILVVTMLIAPGASAYLWTNRLPRMLGLAACHAVLSTLLGLEAAISLDASVAGCMSVVGMILFLLSFILSPVEGLVSRLQKFRPAKAPFSAEPPLVEFSSAGSEATKPTGRKG